MISTFRAARAQAQDKAPFDSLVEELAGQSKEFREWWKGVDVQGFDGGERLRHPRSGLLEFSCVALTPEGRPDLSLVTYMPRPSSFESKA